MGHIVRNVAILIVIGLVVAKGLSYVTATAINESSSPGTATAAPPGATPKQVANAARNSNRGQSLVIRAAPGGHFLLDALINGVRVRFMVDTGASDVILTSEDARRVGFNKRNLKFNRAYQTANGIVRGAGVTLREVSIDQLSLYDVRASVNEGQMHTSLLGMSFLSRLRGYEVADNELILRW